MAVYTHISPDEAKRHLAGFGIGAFKALHGVASGVTNTNYVLETTGGKFILTLFEERVNVRDLPFFFRFMEHLRAAGIPVAEVVKDAEGREITHLRGRPAVVTTFLKGASPQFITPACCVAAGATLARMHGAAEDFTPARDNGMGLAEWRRLIGACGGGADGLEKGLIAELDAELNFLEKNLPQDLPRGAVHADFFPDNVFIAGADVSGVIDFYFSCTDFFAYDLMLALNAWCFDASGLARDQSVQFLAGYLKHRDLSPWERENLPVFGRAAALRIVATRLYDRLHPKPGAIVTPKDPLEHLRILRFHRGASLQDYGLP